MESNIYGISGYQQASSWQKTENKKAEGKDAQVLMRQSERTR